MTLIHKLSLIVILALLLLTGYLGLAISAPHYSTTISTTFTVTTTSLVSSSISISNLCTIKNIKNNGASFAANADQVYCQQGPYFIIDSMCGLASGLSIGWTYTFSYNGWTGCEDFHLVQEGN